MQHELKNNANRDHPLRDAFELVQMRWAVQTLGFLPCDSRSCFNRYWCLENCDYFACSRSYPRWDDLLEKCCFLNSALKHEPRIVSGVGIIWYGRWAKTLIQSLIFFKKTEKVKSIGSKLFWKSVKKLLFLEIYINVYELQDSFVCVCGVN